MATCDTCGNEYEQSFQILMLGKTYTFDSFECAINRLAPSCGRCGTRVIGHGIQKGGEIFCCAHCADPAAHK